MNLFSSYGQALFGQAAFGALPFMQASDSPPPASRTFFFHRWQDMIAIITPGEVIDYAIEWSGVEDDSLECDETIVTSSWSASGLTLTNPPPSIQSNNTSTTVWLSGAIWSGQNVFIPVTNTITTSGGRTLMRTFIVKVVQYKFGDRQPV